MAKKLDLTANFKGIKQNIKKFSNDKTKPEKPKKRTILIWAPKSVVNRYVELAFQYYRENEILAEYSWANFFRVAIPNVEKTMSEKYTLVKPSDDYLKFYRRKSKSANSEQEKYYNSEEEEQRINLFVEEEWIERYFILLHTFFIKERNTLTNFSVSLFFNDFVDILESQKVEYYE